MKVLILTSGIGSRLGSRTEHMNKALVRVGDKPALSHVIDYYPNDTEFVITVGYRSEQIRDFLAVAYPDLKVALVPVDNYDGPGSSLVYSMLQARYHLTCPFIYHACDTLIQGQIVPWLSARNWIAGCRSDDSTEYTSFSVSNDKVTRIYPKGEKSFDYLYIGMARINEWQLFFNTAERLYNAQPDNRALSDIDVTAELIRQGSSFYYVDVHHWLDAGNISALKKANEAYGHEIELLCKDTESMYVIGDKVVKFFCDPVIAEQRVKRAEILKGLVPTILNHRGGFYSYQYKQGQVLSSIVTDELMAELLECIWTMLWEKPLGAAYFDKTCERFYYDKTRKRVMQFLDKYNLTDSTEQINGLPVPTVSDMLDLIPKDWLCCTEASGFHGDFILDNILYDGKEFTLLDWRQNFGGELEYGDMYYDLAKLNHNLTISHKLINQGHFSVERGRNIEVDLLTSYRLASCRAVLRRFVEKKNLDQRTIDLLTPIIWLNMAPLHEYPLDMFLFYFGKLNLWKAINEHQKNT